MSRSCHEMSCVYGSFIKWLVHVSCITLLVSVMVNANIQRSIENACYMSRIKTRGITVIYNHTYKESLESFPMGKWVRMSE